MARLPRPARKDQVKRLVKAWENQDEGMATSNKAERMAAGLVTRVTKNSTRREQTLAYHEYVKKHGYQPRMGDDGYSNRG